MREGGKEKGRKGGEREEIQGEEGERKKGKRDINAGRRTDSSTECPCNHRFP